MYEIKKFDVLSTARITAFVITAVYLVAATSLVIILFITNDYATRHFFEPEFDDFTFVSVLGIAIIVGIVGFGAGAAGSAVYNKIAGKFSGVKMDIEMIDDESYVQPQMDNTPKPPQQS
ncbi:MAG: hypothetical protein ACNFW9_00595 [Candidatus Kerfeldbacteria bacterium]|jgi:hypothetical protein